MEGKLRDGGGGFFLSWFFFLPGAIHGYYAITIKKDEKRVEITQGDDITSLTARARFRCCAP